MGGIHAHGGAMSGAVHGGCRLGVSAGVSLCGQVLENGGHTHSRDQQSVDGGGPTAGPSEIV
jgi:hypothetical protein